ncbi:hypothetical protein P4048_06500 [Pseudomonas aeruginosa]|nr:hypothetical protein [Pseudomonas aeruginosa]
MELLGHRRVVRLQLLQLVVVLVEAHATRAVAVLARQVQALLCESVVKAATLIEQAALLRAHAHGSGGTLTLEGQRILLLLERIAVGLDCLGLFLQAPLFVELEDFQVGVCLLLRLDHVVPGLGDLLVQADALGRRGGTFVAQRLQRLDFPLIGCGDLVLVLADQFAALRDIVRIAQQAGALLRLELLLGVPVVGLQLVQLVLRFGDGGLIEWSTRPLRSLWVFVLLINGLASSGDVFRPQALVVRVRGLNRGDAAIQFPVQLVPFLFIGANSLQQPVHTLLTARGFTIQISLEPRRLGFLAFILNFLKGIGELLPAFLVRH